MDKRSLFLDQDNLQRSLNNFDKFTITNFPITCHICYISCRDFEIFTNDLLDMHRSVFSAVSRKQAFDYVKSIRQSPDLINNIRERLFIASKH